MNNQDFSLSNELKLDPSLPDTASPFSTPKEKVGETPNHHKVTTNVSNFKGAINATKMLAKKKLELDSLKQPAKCAPFTAAVTTTTPTSEIPSRFLNFLKPEVPSKKMDMQTQVAIKKEYEVQKTKIRAETRTILEDQKTQYHTFNALKNALGDRSINGVFDNPKGLEIALPMLKKICEKRFCTDQLNYFLDLNRLETMQNPGEIASLAADLKKRWLLGGAINLNTIDAAVLSTLLNQLSSPNTALPPKPYQGLDGVKMAIKTDVQLNALNDLKEVIESECKKAWENLQKNPVTDVEVEFASKESFERAYGTIFKKNMQEV